MMRLISFLVIVLLGVACAPSPKPRHPGSPPGARTPQTGRPSEEMTAERSASNALVEEGSGALERGLYDRAADLFGQAVTMDPSNGVGYYYLALVKFRTGEYGEVDGLLEKAELLLSNDPEWLQKVETLRGELRQGGPY